MRTATEEWARLLIILYLIASGVLSSPLLYLSAYFERNRQRYYDELLNVSATGDWERWLRYFLIGVFQESRDVLARTRRIRDIQDGYLDVLQGKRAPGSSLRLVEELFANPFMTVRRAADTLGMSLAGARGVLNRLIEVGIVRLDDETWPPLYIADELMEAIEGQMEVPDA